MVKEQFDLCDWQPEWLAFDRFNAFIFASLGLLIFFIYFLCYFRFVSALSRNCDFYTQPPKTCYKIMLYGCAAM